MAFDIIIILPPPASIPGLDPAQISLIYLFKADSSNTNNVGVFDCAPSGVVARLLIILFNPK